jgi:hypothetical protein
MGRSRVNSESERDSNKVRDHISRHHRALVKPKMQ